jgi:hypothetical protein
LLRKLLQKVNPRSLAIIAEGFLFGPQNSLFLEFALLSLCTQPFGSIIVYRGNFPKEFDGKLLIYSIEHGWLSWQTGRKKKISMYFFMNRDLFAVLAAMDFAERRSASYFIDLLFRGCAGCRWAG